MVAIVLCDDDPFTLQLLSELLERAIRQSKAEANLSVWPLLVRSRSSLSAAVEAISIFSIMTWEGIPPNGVDLVRQIYHTDPGGKIVFVTGHGEQGSAGGGAAGKEAELVVSSFCKGRKSCADAIQRSICIGMDFDAVWTDTFSSLAQFPGGDVVVILITLAAGWIGYLIRPI